MTLDERWSAAPTARLQEKRSSSTNARRDRMATSLRGNVLLSLFDQSSTALAARLARGHDAWTLSVAACQVKIWPDCVTPLFWFGLNAVVPFALPSDRV
jgi:hypothetical protein